MKKAYFVLLLLLSIFIYLPLITAPSPPALPVDGNGHLFKIHKLMEDGWKPWIEDWYAGFPFFRFYPPASYLLGAFFGKILRSDILGYSFTLVLTSFIGAWSMFFLLRRLGLGLGAYVGPVIYLLFPSKLFVVYVEANFPRANAINLAPLFVLAVLLLSERHIRTVVFSSLAISAILLTHHSILIPLLVLTLALYGERLVKMGTIENAFKLTALTMLLVAFWYVPFFFERAWVDFWDIYGTHLFKAYSVPPSDLLRPEFLLGLAVFSLSILVLKRRGLRELILAAIFIYLSFGYYSPTPWLHSLLLLRIIPPYRWLDLLAYIVAVAGAKAVDVTSKKVLLVAPLTVTLVISLLFLPTIPRLPDDYLALAEWLGEQPGVDWRFIVDAPCEFSWPSYLPALTGKTVFNGWYHEGNPAREGEEKLWYFLSIGDPTLTYYLRAYAVRFVIEGDCGLVSEDFLRSLEYVPVVEFGRYRVYEANVSFVQPVRVLLIGRYWELPFDYAYLPKLPNELSGVDAIIYAGMPTEEEVKRLEEFAREGGTVIWAPEADGEAFGAEVEVGPVGNLSSSVYDVSLFAPFQYADGPWFGPLFENVTPLVRAGNLTLIGFRDYGRGRVYFLGGNLIFHSLYWNSSYELSIIEGLLSIRQISLNYSILFRSDGRFYLLVDVNETSMVRISEAYYPHWHISSGDKPLKVMRDDRTGLMLVTLESGCHRVSGEFRDPFEKLRLYSGLAWLFLSLYAFPETKKRRVRVRFTPGR
ncbi:6-pyruvoyl-tetrahydropterin synthase-related protein [Pyrococcus yayanosii]|uniref:Membrane protein 6-pyruvoyl-tetrahydropterin synthase-related domain-containing protein n=1 Tax=Pyrococcus yayanosii (strain CH1 / JCM 16557) TaxID=529709 RepID=F8AJF5_PYRYC|nr:6-pyruvoyl-tetrahydropterin synthase-related protein [Pyrococcus yayanosii]AEH25040.1 hypothetical protein PYCH_13700 [Pyrococcus yayanosii CH1]